MPERSDPMSNAEIVHNVLAPEGFGGAGTSASLPLLNDAPASPASRTPRISPAALRTQPVRFFSSLLDEPDRFRAP